ncbi:glycosyltransferase family 4 protein [Glaciihabitans sp. dw_435]|uniref:glycosyltransferase family 4 protein n=1 Tax=Glaciihabitans sp. dw_435 TaxID=2720081 RepID=UPI001BD37CFF|nr:glycosyltransferase family 4 protein [Glaciihabitans sp. dw_435]
MRLVFAITEPHIPDAMGGGVLDIHQLSRALVAAGHRVDVFAALAGHGRLLPYRARQLMSRSSVVRRVDDANGYPTTRVLRDKMGFLVADRMLRDAPDVLILQGTDFVHLVTPALSRGVAVIIRIVTAESADELGQRALTSPILDGQLRHPLVSIVSNSAFVAARVADQLGVTSPVIYPYIDIERCIAPRRQVVTGRAARGTPVSGFVTLVNPTSLKGVDVALAVAALLPECRFLFLEAWHLPAVERAELVRRVDLLPNVEMRPQTDDMAAVYAETAVLFVPSQWEEAFGRVVIEAAANGIPAVASRIGGLPEAMSDGGVLLESTEQPEHWARGIARLLYDRKKYADVSERAMTHSRSPQFAAEVVLAQFLDVASRLTAPARDVVEEPTEPRQV